MSLFDEHFQAFEPLEQTSSHETLKSNIGHDKHTPLQPSRQRSSQKPLQSSIRKTRQEDKIITLEDKSWLMEHLDHLFDQATQINKMTKYANPRYKGLSMRAQNAFTALRGMVKGELKVTKERLRDAANALQKELPELTYDPEYIERELLEPAYQREFIADVVTRSNPLTARTVQPISSLTTEAMRASVSDMKPSYMEALLSGNKHFDNGIIDLTAIPDKPPQDRLRGGQRRSNTNKTLKKHKNSILLLLDKVGKFNKYRSRRLNKNKLRRTQRIKRTRRR